MIPLCAECMLGGLGALTPRPPPFRQRPRPMSQAAVISSSLRCCLGGSRGKFMKFNDKSLRGGMYGLAFIIILIISMDTGIQNKILWSGLVNLFSMVCAAAYRWQTLIAGLLTLVTAAFAANYVVAQMRQSQELENEKRSRKRRAWVALMPQAMSTICDYCKRSYAELVTQHAVASQAPGLTSANNPVPNMPELDESIFAEISAMIECAQTDREADSYAELLSQIQIHRVRWRGRHQDLQLNRNIRAVDLETEMVLAAEIYARASNLLGASRPNPTAGDLELHTRFRALFLVGGRRRALQAVDAIANRQDRANPLPAPETAPPPAPASH